MALFKLAAHVLPAALYAATSKKYLVPEFNPVAGILVVEDADVGNLLPIAAVDHFINQVTGCCRGNSKPR